MGRKKNGTPQRRLAVGSEVLGRQSLEDELELYQQDTTTDASSFWAMRMAHEVCLPDDDEIQQELYDSDDDNGEDDKKKITVHKKKKQTFKRLRRSDKKKKPANKKKKQQTKTVQFANEIHWPIPPPEIRILHVSSPNESNPHLELQYRGKSISHPNDTTDNNTFQIWSCPLNGVAVTLYPPFKGTHTTVLPVTSFRGVLDILELVDTQRDTTKTTREKRHALATAVAQHDTLTLRLVVSTEDTVMVEIGLLPNGIDACHYQEGTTHELRQRHERRRQRATQQQQQTWPPLLALQHALAWMFPESVVHDVLSTNRHHSSSTSSNVSATHVYALTDNVQLQQRSAQQQQLLLPEIPGLVPTLRPYQQHAVAWMLQREQASRDSHDEEWKLVWMVLDGTGVTPLSEWSNHTATQEVVVFHCPFTGWLTRSLSQARQWCLGDQDEEVVTRGGILAESMGLGKTVEVLACILGNPRPTTATTRSLAPRRLKFDIDDDSESIDAHQEFVSREVPTATSSQVETINDMSEFADAEESDSDGDSAEQPPVSKMSPTSTKRPTTKDAVLVTPERRVEEWWQEDDVIGSCVCSKLICFSGRRPKEPVIICRECHEPMHFECAAFESKAMCLRETEPLHIKQHFTNKTVECRLCDKAICPCCAASYDNPMETSATLIITPAAILNQWIREIGRHARKADGSHLNVCVYDSMQRICQSPASGKAEKMKLLHPRHLVKADVVLMTFDSLMSDLGHSDENKFLTMTGEDESKVAQLRARKRYRVVPSPLQSILWWRVALDEAQRVETPTAASARMALKLHAVHRWCVSGTPIGRGKMEDLYGLLLFLRLHPFADKRWFRVCFDASLRDYANRICHLLKNVFWRSTKALESVRQQMGVPEQIEKKVILKFSSIERHFYDRQLEQTLSLVTSNKELGSQLHGTKRQSKQLSSLSDQIHRLRAACCHPQVGSSGIGLTSNKRRKLVGTDQSNETGLGNRVMTMSEILDRFIDDAKQKCEEAQRLVVMHTNAMAAISRLKIEAKERDVVIKKTDKELLCQSLQLYKESLTLAQENACPTLATGMTRTSGSVGFRAAESTTGKLSCSWKLHSNTDMQKIWCRVDFDNARKLTQFKFRVMADVPDGLKEEASSRFSWQRMVPQTVTLQVASAAVDGEFVDVTSIFVEHSESRFLKCAEGFLTNKSKAWRIVLDRLHPEDTIPSDQTSSEIGHFAGIEVELYEACIASDPLQRLHSLHNALITAHSFPNHPSGNDDCHDIDNATMIQEESDAMKREADEIESLYIQSAKTVHSACHCRFEAALKARRDVETRLLGVSMPGEVIDESLTDSWEDSWWDDALALVRLHGSDHQQSQIYERIFNDVESFTTGRLRDPISLGGSVAFPEFGDISGLRTSLNLRVNAIRDGLGAETSRSSKSALRAAASRTTDESNYNVRVTRFRCPVGGHDEVMRAIRDLSEDPSESEKFENSHCQVCKADWYQTGPQCRHCKIGERLSELPPDRVTLAVLKAILSAMKSSQGQAVMKSASSLGLSIVERGNVFFELLQAEARERTMAWKLWRAHLDLLNDHDELNQCKTAMRLSYADEDLSKLPEENLNAIVVPIDINTRYHDHAAKQAMSLGDLRRAKETLRYLKNQSKADEQSKVVSSQIVDDEVQCVVCLSSFGPAERAVLRCGHTFHMSPCLEGLKTPGGWIACPMRCRTRTEYSDVMIATDRRGDDGSKCRHDVIGSWGTKVTRLVSDILEARSQGEKGIVFSQWDDMNFIVESALTDNSVKFARARTLREIGSVTEHFVQDPDCTILLLNVKNGAEGLTLLEAQHIFMIEPLLNWGLDSQAINRIHRIGQNKRTYVHRYLIENTIEMKIDKLRMEHHDEVQDLADSLMASKKPLFRAGGIDGGFQSQEELLDALQPDTQ